MAEQPPNPAVPPALRDSLHAVSQLLRQARHLDPEAQRDLADLVDELGNALGSPNVKPEELTHLSESTTRLVEALHQQHDEGVLAAARERLEEVAAGLEARAPNLAGITRRLLDTLSNLGI
ncbi:MAG: DUF4404 family protein [Gemmataceae bacterium]|nr:DUF4404 family protein [Gemmataceae bacterium]